MNQTSYYYNNTNITAYYGSYNQALNYYCNNSLPECALLSNYTKIDIETYNFKQMMFDISRQRQQSREMIIPAIMIIIMIIFLVYTILCIIKRIILWFISDPRIEKLLKDMSEIKKDMSEIKKDMSEIKKDMSEIKLILTKLI